MRTIVCLLLLGMITTGMVTGQEGRRERRVERKSAVAHLDLSADQQKQFDKLKAELEKSQIATRAKIQSLRVDLRQMIREDKPDQRKIESSTTEIGNLRNQLNLSRIAFWFNVNKFLTPEQQEVWKDHARMMREGKEHGKKMRKHFRRGPMHRPGRMMERIGMEDALHNLHDDLPQLGHYDDE